MEILDSYMKYWKDFFKPEGAIRFEERGYEIVKHLLLNTKGIFSPAERYDIFESSMDSLLDFMKQNYQMNDALQIEATRSAPAKTSISVPAKSEHLVMNTVHTSITDILKKYGVTHEIDFTKNEFLCEYFLFMKKRFTGLFLSSLVDQEDLFVRKDWAVGVGLKSVCTMVPVFGDLLKIAGIGMVALHDMSVKRKLERISDLAVNYTDLPDRIARIMVLLRVNAIMAVSKTKVKVKGKSMISDALEQMGIKNKLTRPQLLAFNDSKIVEGALLVLIETKQINVVHFPEINSLLEKVVEVLISTNSITLTLEGEISDDEQSKSRYTEIVIDKAMLRKNEYLPRNLLRGKEEPYEKYYDRVNSYLKSITVENLNDILAKIDPLDPKYRPIASLVVKRIRKKEKCTLI